MGNLTLSLEKQDEEKLRRIAQQKYSGKKGSLSKVVSEALGKIDVEFGRQRARDSLLKKMRDGVSMGKLTVRHRSELYDR